MQQPSTPSSPKPSSSPQSIRNSRQRIGASSSAEHIDGITDYSVNRASAKIFVVDTKMQVIVINEGFADAFAVPIMGAQGKIFDDVFVASKHESSALCLRGWIDAALCGKETLHEKLVLIPGGIDGVDTCLLINTVPQMSDCGEKVIGAICVAWDVSQMPESVLHDMQARDRFRCEVFTIEQEMVYLSRALAAAEFRYNETLEMKRNFVRGVSHEIRTPLNVVLAGLQLIEYQLSAQVSREVLLLIREIKQSCQDGVDILDDLLAYEKMDGKLIVLEKEPISANALVKECLSPFLIQARVAEIRIEFEESSVQSRVVDAAKDITESLLTEYVIDVDGFKLRQVIRNLISNAIKFTPAHGLVKCLLYWKSESVEPLPGFGKGFIRLEVVDSGVGLTKENQARLFNEIIQFNAAAQQRGGGSGLGLWLAKSLVKINGGCIGVHSDGPGMGSTFFVEFPVFDTITQTAVKLHLKSSYEIDFDETLFGRVLLVDDSTLSRKMVARLLRSNFKDVVEANDGLEAINMYNLSVATNNPFEVILMDNQMPNMDGLEAASALRKLGYAGALIGLTGYGERDQIQEFTDKGVDYVLVKPLSHMKFMKVARSIISSRSRAKALCVSDTSMNLEVPEIVRLGSM